MVNVEGDGTCLIRCISIGHTKQVIDDNGVAQENNYQVTADLIKDHFCNNKESYKDWVEIHNLDRNKIINDLIRGGGNDYQLLQVAAIAL